MAKGEVLSSIKEKKEIQKSRGQKKTEKKKIMSIKDDSGLELIPDWGFAEGFVLEGEKAFRPAAWSEVERRGVWSILGQVLFSK